MRDLHWKKIGKESSPLEALIDFMRRDKEVVDNYNIMKLIQHHFPQLHHFVMISRANYHLKTTNLTTITNQ